MNLPPRATWSALFCAAVASLSCGEEPVTIAAETPVVEAPAPAPQAQRPAAAPDLLARRELALGARPLSVLAQDFDGDGFDDLAVAVEKPGRLILFPGSRNGLGAESGTLAIGDFPTDLRGFGGQLFVGSKATGELLAIDVRREGGELVPRVAWRNTPGGTPRALAVGKLGESDEVRVLWATRDERVLLVNQAGAQGTLELDAGARTVEILCSADGSGFALLCQGTRDLRLFDMSADGQPTERQRLAFDDVPRSAAEADLDGDGDREAIFIGGDDKVVVFGLGVTGGFAAGEPLFTTQPNLLAAALEPCDLDGDGTEELVSLGLIDQGYSVLGGFEPGGPRIRLSEYAGQDPWDLSLGDFDGDGRVDLAVACRAANAISLLAGTGIVRPSKAAFHQAVRVAVGANPLSIAAADLFGPSGDATLDGRPEVATLDAADGMLSLLGNNGFGGLSLLTRLPVGPSPRGLTPLIVAKDRAALLALVVPTGQSGRLVAFGSGPDGFGPLPVNLTGPAAATPLGAADEAQLAAGDFDADGLGDLVVADSARPELHVLLGRGLGPNGLAFEARPPVALPGVASAIAVVRRPDGLRVAVAIGAEIFLVDIAGQPNVQVPALSSTHANRGCSRLVGADLTGDGFDDLAALWLGPQGTSPGRLTIATLGGGLKTAYDLPTGLAPADLGAADLNGDGLAELFVAGQNSHSIDLWFRGEGLALSMAPSIGVGLGPFDVVAVDLLGKGLPDLVVANAFSGDVSVVYNRPRAPR